MYTHYRVNEVASNKKNLLRGEIKYIGFINVWFTFLGVKKGFYISNLTCNILTFEGIINELRLPRYAVW